MESKERNIPEPCEHGTVYDCKICYAVAESSATIEALRARVAELETVLFAVNEDITSTHVCLTHCDPSQLSRVEGPHWDYIIKKLGDSVDLSDEVLASSESQFRGKALRRGVGETK